MRYTEYNSELGRFVVPCYYKEDGDKITFNCISGETEYVEYDGPKCHIRLPRNKTPDLVYGEVIDRLAALENEEELRTTTALKATVDDETAKKLKVAKQLITDGEVKSATIPHIEPAVASRADEMESKLERTKKDLTELQIGVTRHTDEISDLFYDVEWMKDDMKEVTRTQEAIFKNLKALLCVMATMCAVLFALVFAVALS